MKLDEPMPLRWQNAFGSALIFTMSLTMVWLMVRLGGISAEVAFLVQILWLVSGLCWHRPSTSNPESKDQL